MSPVTVGELTTEVTPAAAPPANPASGQDATPWEELERARRAEFQLVSERERTRAEGFDA